jgi:hypothetical protein
MTSAAEDSCLIELDLPIIEEFFAEQRMVSMQIASCCCAAPSHLGLMFIVVKWSTKASCEVEQMQKLNKMFMDVYT